MTKPRLPFTLLPWHQRVRADMNRVGRRSKKLRDRVRCAMREISTTSCPKDGAAGVKLDLDAMLERLGSIQNKRLFNRADLALAHRARRALETQTHTVEVPPAVMAGTSGEGEEEPLRDDVPPGTFHEPSQESGIQAQV